MGVYTNTGSNPHRQRFYGLSTDDKPTSAYVGDRLYIIDTGVHEIWNGSAWVEYFEPKLSV
jgi:hypothetical protein